MPRIYHFPNRLILLECSACQRWGSAERIKRLVGFDRWFINGNIKLCGSCAQKALQRALTKPKDVVALTELFKP